MVVVSSFEDMESLNDYIDLCKPVKIISINSIYFDNKFHHFDIFYIKL